MAIPSIDMVALGRKRHRLTVPCAEAQPRQVKLRFQRNSDRESSLSATYRPWCAINVEPTGLTMMWPVASSRMLRPRGGPIARSRWSRILDGTGAYQREDFTLLQRRAVSVVIDADDKARFKDFSLGHRGLFRSAGSQWPAFAACACLTLSKPRKCEF